MASLHALLHAELPPGLYRLVAGITLDDLRRSTLAHDMRFIYVDGSTIDDKRSFLHTLYTALNCPDYVALNWDAFEEAIRDLDWLTPRAILLFYDYVDPFIFTSPRQWATALSILEAAVTHWSDTSRPLYVLMSGADPSLDGLPEVAVNR